MENLSIENSSSALNINVLDNKLKSNEEIKLENILEKAKIFLFNEELLDGDNLIKIKDFF
jgi:hypothetical protein